MATRETGSKNKKQRKPAASRILKSEGPNKAYYEEVDSHEVYRTEKRIGKVFGVRRKTDGQYFVRLFSKSKRPYGWSVNWGFNLHNFFEAKNLLRGIRKVVHRIGWGDIFKEADIEQLKAQLREKEESIVELERENEEARAGHEDLMKRLREYQEATFRSKSEEFKRDIEELRFLLKQAKQKSIKEEVLQEFLFNHTWMLGTEYINAEPQKLRGAHSRFDFYLERFNKTNDIVEIKRISDPIVNKDGRIGAPVIQAVDQLIEYMESAAAVAQSTTLSKEEDIRELRPRGIVVMGADSSANTREKLHKWNYQLAHITILSYYDVLEKAETLIKHVEEAPPQSQ